MCMVREESGLEDQTWKASKPLLGLTDFWTVMLDFDGFSFRSTRYWSLKTDEEFELGGGAIFRSSYKHYHTIFDRYVGRLENLRVIGWVAILSRSVSMLRYLAMQCIKPTGSTLRVSPNPNKGKPSPRLVYRFGCQDHAVKDFLRFRRLIKRIHRSVY